MPSDLSEISTLTLYIHYRCQFGKISVPHKPRKDVRVDSYVLVSEATLGHEEKRVKGCGFADVNEAIRLTDCWQNSDKIIKGPRLLLLYAWDLQLW